MVNIERASEQLDAIKNNFDNSNHTFMKQLVEGLSKEIEDATGIKVKPTNKESSLGKIKLELLGQKKADVAGQEILGNDIRRLFDELRNPSALLDLLD